MTAAFWQSDLNATLLKASRIADDSSASSHVRAWLSGYDETAAVSSNFGAQQLPFQRWLKFKEAFSPKFVVDALASLERKPHTCLDPFGGCGTTALTCSLLGVRAITMEVNPFLADLIEAKVTYVDSIGIVDAYSDVVRTVERGPSVKRTKTCLGPASLREPGVNGRFVFSAEVFDRIAQTCAAIEQVPSRKVRRLLRVLLGSVLVEASNVVVNGKGRRYRGSWQRRRVDAARVDELFADAVRLAVRDMAEFGGALRSATRVLRGDSRVLLASVREKVDVALFSPPYPNSFDYTDVYNLELWMLGYLRSPTENRKLRQATLRSHVQVKWKRTETVSAESSRTLKKTLIKLDRARESLWDPRLVAMVADYFEDMATVLRGLRRCVKKDGQVIAVVGDSCYADVRVDTVAILCEIASREGFEVRGRTRIRSMRNSAQHGGKRQLSEDCLVLRLST